MTELESIDFFTDQSVITDPYGYFDAMRQRCPVSHAPLHDVMVVTGYDEAMAIYRDSTTFSSCNAIAGPFPGLPFTPTGDDISAQIDQHRAAFPMGEHIATQDPPTHTHLRGLLSRLMTPRRLKENEGFMWSLADRLIDEFVDAGKCEFVEQYAKAFSMLVIADLLGVPVEDHADFRAHLAAHSIGGKDGQALVHNPLEYLDDRFTTYVEDRRHHPRQDVLTAIAEAKYPDGSTPEIRDVVHLSTFLFIAGQDTSSKLLTSSLRTIAEQPGVQQLLRDDPTRIPNFIEESLRTESPIKSHFRLTTKPTTVGGVAIPVGSTVMLLPGASNRDPRRFADPDEFDVNRPNVREHLAFGRGNHSCPGGPLARVEGRVTLERVLNRLGDIRIAESAHGPVDARRYCYEPVYLLRGLTELHLEFEPIS